MINGRYDNYYYMYIGSYLESNNCYYAWIVSIQNLIFLIIKINVFVKWNINNIIVLA